VRRGKIDRDRRSREAEERQAERDKRTDSQQIARLQKAGHWTTKEIRRLSARIMEATK